MSHFYFGFITIYMQYNVFQNFRATSDWINITFFKSFITFQIIFLIDRFKVD